MPPVEPPSAASGGAGSSSSASSARPSATPSTALPRVGIDEALNLLEDDDELWAGVITGNAAVFSAGTDLRDGTGGPTERGGEYGMIRRRRSKPLIAAVEGPAFGGGFEIALACDLVVASRTARFALPESRRGVIASSGALFRAMRALPLNVARELLITGAVLDADRGYQIGFVNRVTDPGRRSP